MSIEVEAEVKIKDSLYGCPLSLECEGYRLRSFERRRLALA
jgi:hypothetical protein